MVINRKEVRKIKIELEKGSIFLVVAPDVNSSSDFVVSLAKNYKQIYYLSYVTLSKPYHALVKHFKFRKIDAKRFFFIDCITKSVIKRPKKVKNCVFVPNLTDLKKTLRKILQSKKFDILIFDSLSSLLVYEKEQPAAKFLHELSVMIKCLKRKAIFIILEKDVEKSVIKHFGMLTDKTLWLK